MSWVGLHHEPHREPPAVLLRQGRAGDQLDLLDELPAVPLDGLPEWRSTGGPVEV